MSQLPSTFLRGEYLKAEDLNLIVAAIADLQERTAAIESGGTTTAAATVAIGSPRRGLSAASRFEVPAVITAVWKFNGSTYTPFVWNPNDPPKLSEIYYDVALRHNGFKMEKKSPVVRVPIEGDAAIRPDLVGRPCLVVRELTDEGTPTASLHVWGEKLIGADCP